MQYRPLGRTDVKVSSVCLGTMTWGEQNSEKEAHEQLDYALERGINFIDTAEMYPVPGRALTQGRTETYIGTWLAARQNRDKLILATKIAGRAPLDWCRDDATQTRHTRVQIDEAVEKSLRRLQTDYIDLYQLHWPDRAIPAFGIHSYYDYDASDMEPLGDILESLGRHVEKGNIRHIGVSNEYPWAVMKFLALSETQGLPRIVSNQCVYSLLARRFDHSGAEIAMREQVGLLAYSPLGMGTLSGKYMGGQKPEGSRGRLFYDFMGRYNSDLVADAVTDIVGTARELGLTPVQFALKFAESREFVTSSIIGATSMEQLVENIDAHDIEWTRDMEKQAHRINKDYRSPVN